MLVTRADALGTITRSLGTAVSSSAGAPEERAPVASVEGTRTQVHARLTSIQPPHQ
jgi:hypothetical protein